MVYEQREWADGCVCLYTDDPALLEAALQSRQVVVVSSYFKTERSRKPFAWDIVGQPAAVEKLAKRYERLAR